MFNTHEDRVEMLKRIPAETLKEELAEYFATFKDVTEARDVLLNFLQFYTRKR